MSVLNELHVKIEKAEEPMSIENMRAGVSRAAEPGEDNMLRGFVTVTRAMNGLHFRLATVSLFILVVSVL